MLIINRVKLHNFGAITDKVFNFQNNINIINGCNGKGKSTVLTAIRMCLLNDFTGKIEDYINNKYNNMSCEIDFTVNNNSYTVNLDVSKKKSITSVKILSDSLGKILTSSTTDTNDYLSKLFDKITTPYAIAYTQGSDNKITNISDSDRRELVKKLFDINFTSQVKEIYDTKIDVLKSKVDETKGAISLLNNKEYNFVEIDEPTDTEIQLYETNKELLNSKQRELDTFNEKQKYNDLLSSTYNKIVSSKNSLIEDKEYTDYLLKNAESLINEVSTNESISEEITQKYNTRKLELEQIIDSDKKQLNLSLDTKELEINDKLAELGQYKVKLCGIFNQNQLDDINMQIANIKQQQTEIDKNIEELKSRLANIEQGICPYSGLKM